MRLIDADKLMESLNPKESVWVGLVLSELIANAPTIKAIPIEYIEKVIKSFDCEEGNKLRPTWAHVLKSLIEFWEFENGEEEENETN